LPRIINRTLPSEEALLRQRFAYNAATGTISYRIDPPGLSVKHKAGDIATHKGDKAYLKVYVGNPVNRYIKAHRLAWFLFYGEFPQKHIDHINNDPTDNRIVNLREVTTQQNTWNAKAKTGTSRYKGVTWRRIRWGARIRKDGVLYDLGLYDNEEDAALAYNRKAIELFGNFAGLNPVLDDGRILNRRPRRY
jgi:hypothetical protein